MACSWEEKAAKLEWCRNWVEENTGCTMLSTVYVNCTTLMQFTCETCGEPFKRSWNHFYSQKQHKCRACASARYAVRPSLGEIARTYVKNKTGADDAQYGRIAGICCNAKKWEDARESLTSYRISAGADKVHSTLKLLCVDFRREYSFADCSNARALFFDFAVMNHSRTRPSLLIEFDGKQHTDPTAWGGQQAFEYRQRNDRIKDSYCRDHGIPLLRISYKQFDQIEQLVTDKLYELNILQKEAA